MHCSVSGLFKNRPWRHLPVIISVVLLESLLKGGPQVDETWLVLLLWLAGFLGDFCYVQGGSRARPLLVASGTWSLGAILNRWRQRALLGHMASW